MSNDAFEYNNKGLKKLIDALEDKLPMAKVGILGDKNKRDGNGADTNASIGAKHEFGDHTVPQRSFLRTPLIDNFQEYLDKSGAFDEESFKEVIKTKSFLTYIKKLGIIGETIVADAFESGGFGKWTPSKMEYKTNHQTLVETQQLRNSITSAVDDD